MSITVSNLFLSVCLSSYLFLCPYLSRAGAAQSGKSTQTTHMIEYRYNTSIRFPQKKCQHLYMEVKGKEKERVKCTVGSLIFGGVSSRSIKFQTVFLGLLTFGGVSSSFINFKIAFLGPLTFGGVSFRSINF